MDAGRRAVAGLVCLAASVVLVISLLGWHRYTSVGVDLGAGDNPDRTETAVRVKWYGDGTLHLGAGHGASPHPNESGFTIDPAGAVLTGSRDQRVGALEAFGTIEWLAGPGVRDGWEHWLVLPAWIPAVIAMVTLIKVATRLANLTDPKSAP